MDCQGFCVHNVLFWRLSGAVSWHGVARLLGKAYWRGVMFWHDDSGMLRNRSWHSPWVQYDTLAARGYLPVFSALVGNLVAPDGISPSVVSCARSDLELVLGCE